MEPLQAGDPLRMGPFRVLRRLGSGGMGRVYLSGGPDGAAVAVKVVHPHLLEDGAGGEFRRRFAQEVGAARAVDAAFTAAVVDADPDAEVPWLATEFIPGVSLDDAVARFGPLPEASLLDLAVGLFTALTGVHAPGLVHRDIKPSNVILGADGPKVIDFGIARLAGATAVTRTAQTVGTWGYMSPEQFERSDVGPESDVFSAAVSLAYAATGRRPFPGDSLPVLFANVTTREPDLDGLPATLAPVVMAALAKDPAARPTAHQARAMLPAAPTGGSAGSDWLPSALTRAIVQVAGSMRAAMDSVTPADADEAAIRPVPETAVNGRLNPAPPPPPSAPPGTSAPHPAAGAATPATPQPDPDPSMVPTQSGPVRPRPSDAVLRDGDRPARRRAVRLSIIGAVTGLAVVGGAVAWTVSPLSQGRADSPAASRSGVSPTPTPGHAGLAPTPEPAPSLVTVLAVQSAPAGGYTDEILEVAFSPDGRKMVTSGTDSTIKLWDTSFHAQIRTPIDMSANPVFEIMASTVVFSPDSRTMASGNSDGTVRLWNVADHGQIGEPLFGHLKDVDGNWTVPAPERRWGAVAFSPDGHTLAAGADDGAVVLWDAASRRQIGEPLTGHTEAIWSLAFSPDGRTLATGGGDGTARLWDVATRRQVGRLRADRFVAFSPDGRTLAAGSSDGARLWDVATQQERGLLDIANLSSLAYSPDGRTLATGSGSGNGNVRLWDVASHRQIGQPLDSHTKKICCVAFSPDGRTLATAGSGGTVTLWGIPVRP
ncbi:WD40 repeat domain-containing serine/threonine protein kinase [Embleya sp. NBC_00896]|uniref:WD40 repeat domain-containing serine/threonine protein kinase n=1 Tax=Embleya sp. NBC_00896 TaxID=2975961 RepID=UPI003867222B|nr:protein kinase [Embleya sp. NBC_00896]